MRAVAPERIIKRVFSSYFQYNDKLKYNSIFKQGMQFYKLCNLERRKIK